LTGRQDQIKYPSSVNTTGQADDSTQCWFIQTTEGRSQRIYFSIRNAAIAEGQELQVHLNLYGMLLTFFYELNH